MQGNNAKGGRRDVAEITCYKYKKTGHYNKDCPDRQARCANCRKLGHTFTACRNVIIKDKAGYIEARIETVISKIITKQCRDDSKQDNVVSAQITIEKIANELAKMKRKAKER